MTSPAATPDEARPKRIERWERAARISELRGDGPHAISAGGVELVAVRARGKLQVFEGRCPHQGALLGEGELEQGALICRNHRWRFDGETGRRLGGPQCLQACPTRERDGELFVDVAHVFGHDRTGKIGHRSLAQLPGPSGLPFIGNALQVEPERFHLQLEDWQRQHGDLYRLRLGPREALVVSRPERVAAILRARPEDYRRPQQLETILAEMATTGSFSAEGDAWRAQRRLTIEVLARNRFRNFYPTLQLVASRLVRRWNAAADGARVLDLAAELKLFTVDVTTLMVFGHDANTIERGEDGIQRHLELMFPAINRRMNALVPYWRWIRLPYDRRVDRAVDAMRVWLGGLVEAARANVAQDPNRAKVPANLLEAMVVARDLEGRPFSNESIIGNALTALLAGEDTTAYTLAWAVHHMCSDSRVSAMLRAEIDDVLGDQLLPRDVEHADRLVYSTAVVNESMRLRPVAPVTFYEAVRDVVVDDVRIPRGTLIVLLMRPPVLDAARFTEPNVFLPERWLPGWQGAHDPAVCIPFGSGPRICPGRSLALLEMRVALSALYRSFEVDRVDAAQDVSEVLSFTMMPVGLRVRLRRRENPPESAAP